MQSVRSPGPECQPISERLSAFLDDDLSAAERRRVEEHLSTCQYCAADLEDLRLTVRALRALPVVTPPRSFALVDPPARTSWFATLRLATSAMAALFVLVLAINFALPTGSATTPLAAPSLPAAYQASDAESQKSVLQSAPAARTEALAKPAEAPASKSSGASKLASTPAARAAEAKPAAASIQAVPTTAPSGTQQPAAGAAAAPAPAIAQQAAPAPAGTPALEIASAPEPAPDAESSEAPPPADTALPSDVAGAEDTANVAKSANADQAATEQAARELQPPMLEVSEPIWRVWLGWLPLVLAPLVIVLGVATGVAWWRERSWL